MQGLRTQTLGTERRRARTPLGTERRRPPARAADIDDFEPLMSPAARAAARKPPRGPTSQMR